MPLVTLANNKTFSVDGNKTLLVEAKSKGVVLEHSCRTGRCGVCKAKVLSGKTRVIQPEAALTGDEISSGDVLTCCRAAVSDVELDIEDLGRLAEIEIKTVPCRIDSIAILAPDVVEVVLRLPPASRLQYLSGQYVDVILRNIRRSYSIANYPKHDGKLVLQIRHIDQGVMSQYWFNEARVNDLLRLEGPLGTFCLRTIDQSNLVFLATGTGIAPVRALLEELEVIHHSVAGKSIHVYWGGRVPSDIYWQASFDNLSFRFVPVLSSGPAGWRGRTGYVQQALLNDDVDLTDAVVYACGSDAMIHSAREQLTASGLHPKKFYSDAFVSSN